MEILKIILALIIVLVFFATAGVGFGFVWLIIHLTCDKVLRQVIGIEFWLLMISLVILSDQVNATMYIPFLKETIPGVPYWIHVVAVASGFGSILVMILIPCLIAVRIKYGKHTSIFDIKV